MKFSGRWQVFWILILFVITISDSAADDDEEEDDMSRSHRFHGPSSEITCRYRRQQGVCRRRSECRRPTRNTCRFGMDPVVCCMDKDEVTTTTKRRAVRTTPKPQISTPKKLDSVENIDITFPNCGKRSPNVEPRRPQAKPTRRGGGLLSRFGKRDVAAHLRRTRHKRWSQAMKPVIVGGKEAQSNSWPWMVAVFRSPASGGTKRFLCGASLISRRYVLTAAHCFDGEKGQIDPSRFSIIVGSHTTKDGTEYPVTNIQVHPGYQRRQYYNDLCLMKVGREVQLTNKAYPVCLPSEGLRNKIRLDESEVTVTGWGDTTFDGSEYQVTSIQVHPGYQRRQYYNDLCLMKVGREVQLTNKAYPVCLPSEGLRKKIRLDESEVTVTGWGDTTFCGVSSKVLQEVSVPIVPLKECNSSYATVAKANFPRGITNVFICAGLKEGGKDACQGDSGGPMVNKLKDHSFVQLGVVSFGYGCAQAGYPGVYTRLSKYTKWLYDNTDLGR